MPHSPDEKKRAISRLRRIKGQAEALERAVEAGVDCSALLQQIAALRGAANGLMAEVLESHLRETFGLAQGSGPRGEEEASFEPEAELDGIIRMLRTYLK
jgi:DNA-binding FrmR family transcriptional regulator